MMNTQSAPRSLVWPKTLAGRADPGRAGTGEPGSPRCDELSEQCEMARGKISSIALNNLKQNHVICLESPWAERQPLQQRSTYCGYGAQVIAAITWSDLPVLPMPYGLRYERPGQADCMRIS